MESESPKNYKKGEDPMDIEPPKPIVIEASEKPHCSPSDEYFLNKLWSIFCCFKPPPADNEENGENVIYEAKVIQDQPSNFKVYV